MRHVRRAAVAGSFYPGRPESLSATCAELLAAAAVRQQAAIGDAAAAGAERPPKAIIVPHAGYVYSGPIAASAYVRLRPLAGRIRRVILVGPCHRLPIRGLAVPDADGFATPLGTVAVDTEAIALALTLPAVQRLPAAHADEHSLEVQLPFLQTLLGAFRLVPLVVGDADAGEVAAVLDRLWGGDETLIVVSSDLSHYLPDAAARALDARTCAAIERCAADAIGRDQACGRLPIAGLLRLAGPRRLRVTTLDLRNSGDTAGDRARVVGYGAWMLTPAADADRPADTEPLADERLADQPLADAWHPAGGSPAEGAMGLARLLDRHGRTLLAIAAQSIAHGLRHGRPLAVDAALLAPALRADGASFITLFGDDGGLRGCIGTAEAQRPLADDVARNAFAAAFRDPRFPPLAVAEEAALEIKVSVLSPPQPLAFADEDRLLAQLRPGADGLVIESGRHRALFLPDVWQTLPEPAAFLAHLKRKAGLDDAGRAPALRAWRFTTGALAGRLPAVLGDAAIASG